jgi:HK97 family phage portal protein
MNILSSIFSKFITSKIGVRIYGGSGSSAPWSGDMWDHDTMRAVVDTIATHTAKGKFKHVILDKSGHIAKVINNSRIIKLLNERPNDFMSGYELKYKLTAQLETKTTAIAWIRRDEKGNPIAIYPVEYGSFEIREINGGGYAVCFTDRDGMEHSLYLSNCIVLRKYYNVREASGDGNGPIYKVLDMSKASDDNFIESLRKANKIRGIVSNKKGMLDPDDIRKSQEEFAKRFDNACENGGIIGLDTTEGFQPLNMSNYSANAAQMKEVSNRIFTYMRTPERIVQCTYTEQEGIAWTESRIEPIWQQFGEAVTNAFFTEHERECGNRIIISGGILTGTSVQTRVSLIGATREIGMFTTNEQRELLGYPPVEGGDVIQVSLNYIKTTNQDYYQSGKKEENNAGSNEGNNETDGTGNAVVSGSDAGTGDGEF